MDNLETLTKCPRCGFTQHLGEWLAQANYEYNGRRVNNGDHARCPECNKFLHIDYDLIDVDNE